MSTHRAGPAGPRPVRASLDHAARVLGAPPPRVLETVFGRWAEVVGADLAAHCRPLSVSDETLVVAVDDPGWGSQVRYLANDILARIEAAAGFSVATRIAVRVRPPSTVNRRSQW